MSDADAIGSLATGGYLVWRRTAGTRGRYVTGTLSSFQPVTGRQLPAIAEASEPPINGTDPDVIQTTDGYFGVTRVEAWPAFCGALYRAYSSRMERP